MHRAKLLLCAALACASAFAQALEIKPYTAATLAQAEQQGQPVALHFRADWCPTCRAQDKVLDGLKSEPGLKLAVLAVDYDTEKDLKRRFKVNSQSTLIVLHGRKETARLLGETSAAGIRAALESAL